VIISFLWGFRVGALPRDFTGSFVGVIFRETSLGSLASELGSSENMWPVAFRLKDDDGGGGGDRNPVSKARQMYVSSHERTNEREVCLSNDALLYWRQRVDRFVILGFG
jgi:hypothetical protein